MLALLIIWSLAGIPFTTAHGAERGTATPSAETGDRPTPSETPAAAETETPESTTESATETATATPSPTASPTSTIETAEGNILSVPHLSGEFAPDEVLVRFRPRATRTAKDQCLQQAGASIESEIAELSVLVLKVPEDGVAEAMARLSLCPGIRLVEPNYLVHIADTIPSDTSWGLQYGLVNIRAPQGWDYSTGSTAVTIAIVDTGVDPGHPDLAAKIVPGYDIVNDDGDPRDDNGHGTHVAGVAAALANNGAGIAGVSWGARIMPLKVLNAAGDGTYDDVAAGIIWAADQGAQVINLSLGGAKASTVLEAAVEYANAKGAVLVAAAGNRGAGFVLYPARLPHVIAVAATDANNSRASFSNYGPEVALAAPGVSIYSTAPGGSYSPLSGTSLATAFVSGLAAILRGIPGIGSADVIAWEMESTALDLGPAGVDAFYGYGLIQMDRAILAALPPAPEPERPTRQAASGGYGSGGGMPSPTPTFTPTLFPTWTPTAVMTEAVIPGAQPSDYKYSDVSAQSQAGLQVGIPPAAEAEARHDSLLPYAGTGLIVLGAVLPWAWRRRRGKRAHKRYFKLP